MSSQKKPGNTFSLNRNLSCLFPKEEYKKWDFDFREKELKLKIDAFLEQNPNFEGKIFIVYGAAHDFSNEFENYSFEEGKWMWNKSNLHWFFSLFR